MDSVRIDKWLWAARFFKTRSLATDEVNKGHVQVAKQNIKPSREVRVGDTLTVWQAKIPRTITVKAGPRDLTFPAPQYLGSYAIPNFYFHMSAAYNILRANGLDIGKSDFLGG